jgi:putative holliday junction resolvase
MPRPTTLLAFDFGLTRIGVATGQSVTRTATPLATVRARRGEPDWRAIDALVRDWRPDLLLVGLPLNMDSTESEMSVRANAFGVALKARYAIDVEMVDERLTSFEARGLTAIEDERHAIAARLIAETFLNRV